VTCPTDAEVFAKLKSLYPNGTENKCPKTAVNTADNTTVAINWANLDVNHYSVQWYVLKHQSDAWHVDGVICVKPETSGTPGTETPTGVIPSSGNSNPETPKTNINVTAAPINEAPKTDITDPAPPKTETPAAETQTAETPVTNITDPSIPMADAAAQVTGDTLVLWIVLAIASGAALTVMVIDYMRKKNSDR